VGRGTWDVRGTGNLILTAEASKLRAIDVAT
jgi:hypothetical protein